MTERGGVIGGYGSLLRAPYRQDLPLLRNELRPVILEGIAQPPGLDHGPHHPGTSELRLRVNHRARTRDLVDPLLLLETARALG